MRRSEAAERRARERAVTQPVLDCEACGALTPASDFRYFGDRLICEACEYQNPQAAATYPYYSDQSLNQTTFLMK
jgi:hypothetical protein